MDPPEPRPASRLKSADRGRLPWVTSSPEPEVVPPEEELPASCDEAQSAEEEVRKVYPHGDHPLSMRIGSDLIQHPQDRRARP